MSKISEGKTGKRSFLPNTLVVLFSKLRKLSKKRWVGGLCMTFKLSLLSWGCNDTCKYKYRDIYYKWQAMELLFCSNGVALLLFILN